MKRLVLIFLICLSYLFGTTHTIGSGTASQSGQPFKTNLNYSWSKALYTTAELNSAGLYSGTQIYGIGFEISSTSFYQLRNQHIYIRNSILNYDGSNGSAYPGTSGFTQVYSSDLAITAPGWFYVCWETPFIYTGDKLEILWENRSGKALSTSPSFVSTNTQPNYYSCFKDNNNVFPTSNGSLQNIRANLRILTAPLELPAPASFICPQDGGTTLNPIELAWHIPSGQQSSWDLYLGTQNPPPFHSNRISNRLSLDLAPGTNYFWKIVPRNPAGEAQNCPVWSFETTVANQLAESFEASTFPPPGWECSSRFSQDSENAAYHGTRTSTILASSLPDRLISPELSLSVGSSLSFWARAHTTNGNGKIRILVSPGENLWQELALFSLPTHSNWTNYTVDLSALSGTGRIAFELFSVSGQPRIYLDHIVGPNLALGLGTPQDPQISRSGEEIILRWTAVQGASSYLIQYSDDPGSENWEDLTGCSSTEHRFTPLGISRAFYRIRALN